MAEDQEALLEVIHFLVLSDKKLISEMIIADNQKMTILGNNYFTIQPN